MKKNVKVIIALCSALFLVFCIYLFSYLNSTETEKHIAESLGSQVVGVKMIDGADYGVDSMKYRLITNSLGETYLTFHQKAPFGLIKSTGRYYKNGNGYELDSELGYSFQSMNRFYTKYAYVFFGSNTINAAKFEFSVENVGTLVREIDSVEPFVFIFTDDDFDYPDTVSNMKKTIRLLDDNENILYELDA